MGNITGAEVWAKLQQDPKFLQEPLWARNGVMKFVLSSVETLGLLLNEKATPTAIHAAVAAYYKFLNSSGGYEALVSEIEKLDPDNVLLIGLLKNFFDYTIPLLFEVPNFGSERMGQNSLTDVQILTGLGVNSAMLEAYERDELTIGMLLANQPGIIVGIRFHVADDPDRMS